MLEFYLEHECNWIVSNIECTDIAIMFDDKHWNYLITTNIRVRQTILAK